MLGAEESILLYLDLPHFSYSTNLLSCFDSDAIELMMMKGQESIERALRAGAQCSLSTAMLHHQVVCVITVLYSGEHGRIRAKQSLTSLMFEKRRRTEDAIT